MSLDGNATAEKISGKIKDIDVLCIDAYAIAVKNGFEGTEEEWLESLKGEKGEYAEADLTYSPKSKNAQSGIAVDQALKTLTTENGTVVSQNADFAEVAEWADGNPNNEDRTGYFVCANVPVDGIVMRKATSTDDVKGVSILAPAFAGNYTKDKLDSNGNLLPKYSYVAILGFVPVRDNGTCTVGGRCMPDDNGCAIPSSNSMGYQVVNRIDENRVLIIIEPNGDMVQRVKTKITELKEEIKRNSIHNSASGESILLTDSSNYPLEGLKVYGKSTQDGTPTPEAPIPIVSAGASGSVEVKVCGKNLADVWGVYGQKWATKIENALEIISIEGNTLVVKVVEDIHSIHIPNIKHTKTFNVCWTISGGGYDWSYRVITTQNATYGGNHNIGESYSAEIYDNGVLAQRIQIQAVGLEGTIPLGTEITIVGYVNENRNDTEQTPYVKPQTLTLSTPNELRAFPLNKSQKDIANYIDASGQPWLCDYIDLEKGVKVENTVIYTIDGTGRYADNGSTETTLKLRWEIPNYVSPDTTFSGYSNLLQHSFVAGGNENQYAVSWRNVHMGMDGTYFGGTKPTVDDIKALFAKTPMCVLSYRKTPIETPLTAEEIAYYKALHTNYPNTTIFNSDGTNMDVSYIADTKLYIDNKFAELQALALEG